MSDKIIFLGPTIGHVQNEVNCLRNEVGHLRLLLQHAKDTRLRDLTRECHQASQRWWHDPVTGERLQRNKGELLMLIVSEIAEAMEGERRNLMDDKLPHRRMVEVELADALIRIFDYAGAYNLDLDGAVREKLAYNATRADHAAAARLEPNGKKW